MHYVWEPFQGIGQDNGLFPDFLKRWVEWVEFTGFFSAFTSHYDIISHFKHGFFFLLNHLYGNSGCPYLVFSKHKPFQSLRFTISNLRSE